MKGKLYGIGIGPGDPDLVTVKAISVLRTVDVVIIPESGKDRESIALEIAREYIGEDTAIILQTFPMKRAEDEKIAIRKEHARQIEQLLHEGKKVAFLTLGDAMLYSTYIYILNNLKDKGIDIETIPGITSFSAIASKYSIPLALQNEELTIIPLHRSLNIEKCIKEHTNIIFMKVSAAKEQLAEILNKYNDSLEWMMVSDCGRGNERVSRNIEELYTDIPYMTTVIVKHKITGSNKEIL